MGNMWILCIIFFIYYFATHNEITSRIKTIINRLINIKFEICGSRRTQKLEENQQAQ